MNETHCEGAAHITYLKKHLRFHFVFSVNILGCAHDKVGVAYSQVYSFPAVWITQEYAQFTLRTNIKIT